MQCSSETFLIKLLIGSILFNAGMAALCIIIWDTKEKWKERWLEAVTQKPEETMSNNPDQQ